ncbi:autotransporter outer membrane beta-barrel domain-containing protein [Hyphomicrobium sp.]|uniref:autotransporter family protein n=1 Tax=Hyphomicrobium sp. TaxID=82 RepID=UPI000FBFC452|nr:autotransporter outer membrane beta-barrel domain-containing protein [Hyphomicrobium sp.]RUP00542.1 MAG: autotransporter outer membrane beta-barrel domain-containing protein [Hyphomicrobium sp.]
MSVKVHHTSRPASVYLLGSLAAVLSLGVSHQAMAACGSGTAPAIVECTGEDNVYSSPAISFSGTAAKTGILLSPVGEAGSLNNSADITITHTTAPTTGNNIIGIDTEAEGEYAVNNSGNINITSGARGQAYGITGNGDVESLTVTNSGSIKVNRTLSDSDVRQITSAAINITNNPNNGTTGNNATTNSLSIAAGVFSEEELDKLSVTNTASGVIQAQGKFATGVYSRAAEFTLTNNGTIEHLAGAGNGIAVAAVADSGNLTQATVVNNGTITGDVLMVDGHALRWWLLSKGDGRGNQSTGPVIGGTAIDNRLNINSQFGQLDSNIENAGTITGNFYYSNGTHVLTNQSGATITGNIEVDQRPMYIPGRTCTVGASECFSSNTTTGDVAVGNPASEEASQNGSTLITTGANVGSPTTYTYSLWGTKDFTFENAGSMSGSLTVLTAPATTINGFSVPDSKVTILPHIFGAGSHDADNPNNNSGFIGGTLRVADGIHNGSGGTSSLGRTTTIAPVIDSTVASGEWYKVANSLDDAGNVGDLPTVAGTALVSWEVQKNTSGALVIGSNVRDAFDVDGISRPGASTINALLGAAGADAGLDALGGAVQNLQDDADVAKAANQLAPETNYATQQAAITLNNAIGQHIDTRLNAVGATGAYSGSGTPAPYGLGMGQKADPNRSNLGGSLKDSDQDFVMPRSAAVWAQGFGAGMDQGNIDGVDGYNARLYGFIAGYDNWISPNVRLGVAGGYANTNIDGKGDTSQNATAIDSYLIEAYGAFKGTGWYATGRTGFTWHDYDTTRTLTVPFSDQAKGSHDGDQFNAAFEIGAPVHYSGLIVTPVASLTYSRLHQAAYSESSDNGMALDVASQTNNSLVSGLGLKGLVPIAADTVIEGRALWLHEFLDDAQDVSASFAAGGGTFTAAGPGVGRDTANLGIGILADIGYNSTFQLNYDANLREDFVAHVGSARIDINF